MKQMRLSLEGIFWVYKILLALLMLGGLWGLWVGCWGMALGALVVALSSVYVSGRVVPFWWPRKSKRVPHILMLHTVSNAVVNPIARNNTIRPMTLERLIVDLLASGYVFMTLSEAVAAPLKQRTIVLTFDDGCVDNYTHLFPILQRHQVKATLYITSRGGEAFLSEAQIREMVASGLIEVGGHTTSHCELHSCSPEEGYQEIVKNRIALQALTGQAVASFAYPGGFCPDYAVEAVEKAGFTTAVLTKRKVKGKPHPLRLPRTIIPRESTTLEAYCLATRGRKHV